MTGYETRIAQSQNKLEKAFDHYSKELVADDEDKRLLGSRMKPFKPTAAPGNPFARCRGRPSATAKLVEARNMLKAGLPAYNAAQDAVTAWWTYNVKLADQQAQVAAATKESARLIVGTLTLLALGLGIAAAWVITRSITPPSAVTWPTPWPTGT
jgi:methyl-accepting chemotaxis protein